MSSSPLEDGADPLRIDPPAAHRWSEEPFDLVRLAVGSVALLGTILAVVLAVVTHDARMLQLVGALWAVYGLTVGFLSGVLEPVLDGLFQLLVSGGLARNGTGYSSIETLVVQGHHDAAAEAYAERARNPAERVEATLRRSRLLAGPLSEPESAAVELDSLRAHPLTPRDDVRVGLALVDLYENRLDNAGRAMAELRRLIDRHPAGLGARRLRAALRELKSRRYPDAPSP
ncbi:MAG: hypothetical protein ACJ8A6_05665 [Gemmatimonadales bacterium]